MHFKPPNIYVTRLTTHLSDISPIYFLPERECIVAKTMHVHSNPDSNSPQ